MMLRTAARTLLPTPRWRGSPVSRAKMCSKKETTETKATAAVQAGSSSSGLGTMRGPVTYLGLGVTGLAGMGLLLFYFYEKDRRTEKAVAKVTTVGKAALGGPWALVDEEGVPRTNDSYRGQFQLLYFGFTHCPDICPSELVKMGKIIKESRKKGVKVKPLFISVDPGRDSIKQLKEYSKDFLPDFSYLTGTREQVAVATRAYRVYFSKANEHDTDEEDYLVDHSIVMYLLSPEGEFLDFFTQKMQVADVVDKIGARQQEHLKK